MIDRIKRDSEQNWNKALKFIPKQGEVIIYDCDDLVKIKIGDGVTNVVNLPFAEEVVPSLEACHVEDEIIFVK